MGNCGREAKWFVSDHTVNYCSELRWLSTLSIVLKTMLALSISYQLLSVPKNSEMQASLNRSSCSLITPVPLTKIATLHIHSTDLGSISHGRCTGSTFPEQYLNFNGWQWMPKLFQGRVAACHLTTQGSKKPVVACVDYTYCQSEGESGEAGDWREKKICCCHGPVEDATGLPHWCCNTIVKRNFRLDQKLV